MGTRSKATIFGCVVACSIALFSSHSYGEIKIGMGSVFSGPSATYGLLPKIAMEMAIEEINAKGGIKGEKVVLLTRDDGMDTTKAALQTEELLHKEKVNVYFPSPITGSAKATISVCAKAGIPALLGAQSSDITCPNTCVGEKPECCDPVVFRFGELASQSADSMIKLARDKLKGKRIALMHDNLGYGLEWKEDLTKAAAKNKVNLVASEMFPMMELDFTAALSRVKQANPDVIIVATLAAPAARIYNTMQKLGMKQAILLPGAVMELDFRKMANNMGEGAYIVTQQNTSSDTKDPEFAEFSRKWTKRASKFGFTDVFTVNEMEIQYYDAVKFLALVMEKDGKKPKDICEGLENFGPYKGVSGITYVFSKDKHNALSHLPVHLFRFHRGKMFLTD
jgi:branched-chain amino acid transport system substrate-binding protein